MGGWVNPVPGGVRTRGFAPSSLAFDAAMYADDGLRRAHDATGGPSGSGNGPFPGSTRYSHFHAALDIAAEEGVPIYAPEAGDVVDARWGVEGTWANGGGLFVRVVVNARCMYLLAHCSELLVAAGQHVSKGQVIARIGSTGVATGNHTHFVARTGPAPYYDPAAFFWNPALVLPGGPLWGDSRFAPGYVDLPDTGSGEGGTLRAMGDPAPLKFRNLIVKGEAPQIHVRAWKPIRAGAELNDPQIAKTGPTGRNLRAVGLIDVDKLPASERPYGDVYVCPMYDDNGSRFAYVKAVDIR